MCRLMVVHPGEKDKRKLRNTFQWLDDNGGGQGMGVAWQGDTTEIHKGVKMSARSCAKLAIGANKPVMFHTRMATHGSVSDKLCHPFSCGRDTIMCHNGIWSDWEQGVWTLLRRGKSMDAVRGKSDTAIIAMLIQELGPDVLDLVDQGVFLVSNGGRIFVYYYVGSFVMFEQENGVWFYGSDNPSFVEPAGEEFSPTRNSIIELRADGPVVISGGIRKRMKYTKPMWQGNIGPIVNTVNGRTTTTYRKMKNTEIPFDEEWPYDGADCYGFTDKQIAADWAEKAAAEADEADEEAVMDLFDEMMNEASEANDEYSDTDKYRDFNDDADVPPSLREAQSAGAEMLIQGKVVGS